MYVCIRKREREGGGEGGGDANGEKGWGRGWERSWNREVCVSIQITDNYYYVYGCNSDIVCIHWGMSWRTRNREQY